MIKVELENLIKSALTDLGIEAEEIHLEHPVDLAMGDYSTNVAMVYGKNIGQNPKELAEKITEKINNLDIGCLGVGEVGVAGAGFINFYLKKEFFENSINEILKAGEKYGSNENLKGQKILIEHSSPNLFKEFHIGHMVNNSIGESITRIIKNEGADVTAISYPSDVGLGIAKTVWAVLYHTETVNSYKVILKSIIDDYISDELMEQEELKKGTQEDMKKEYLPVQISFLGGYYVSGNASYKSDEKIKKEIDEINKKIYDKSDEEINKIYNAGKKLTLAYFEQIVARLGSKFDDYIFESEAGEVGVKIVKENIGKVFEESDGAIIFKGENFDESLHTRVFINSNDLPTYETKDIGLLKLKFDKYNPDKSIFITDNEQGPYMKVMLKAGEKINSEWADKTKHIGHGRLRFPEGRLSSRDGNVLTVNDILERVKNEVMEKLGYSDKVNKEDGHQHSSIAEQVAIGTLKYSILKSSAGKNIMFDVDKDVALEGNSGPYLQYTVARTNSILEKAKSENISTWNSEFQVDREVSDVEKLLYRFPEVVERAGQEYEPHYIATYLFELAQAFNSYYGNNQIVNKEDENSSYKVALTKAVGQTIKNGLYLLGIEAPERM